ncbi:MAG: winged helix-turn-helix domain-containing protein [Candidatus Bathyarchaeota archaeon]|nr:winged helix-turn-helix domain-containing protein [Candidatus Bathyarchaeota archaeon]
MTTPLFPPFWKLLTGNRGGPSRAIILRTLKEEPQNANQLSKRLKLSYKTITHHLEILQKNHLVRTIQDGYGTTYCLSQAMASNYRLIEKQISETAIENATQTFSTSN